MVQQKSASWFEVNRDGFADVLADMKPARILAELVSNASDELATRVDIEVSAHGRGLTRFAVEDDSPLGFHDLSHAYTLFAPSKKKGDAEKSGRFNFGEKIVLTQCESAEVASTTGTIMFHKDGTRTKTRAKRPVGSKVTGYMRMASAERDALVAEMHDMLPRIPTYINGESVPTRTPIATRRVTLPIQVADSSGRLRLSRRATTIEVFEPLEGRQGGTIYELGFPIVTTGDRFDVNVCQKVPLPLDRSNVPPTFLRELRTAVLEATSLLLSEDEASATWVQSGLPNASSETVKAVIAARFGDNVVSYAVSDPEANSRAVAAGYKVLHGGAFSGEAWDAIRRAEAIKPASVLFPTKGETVPFRMLADFELTEGMRYVIALTERLGPLLIKKDVKAFVISSPRADTAADYGNQTVRYNVNRLGKAFFAKTNLRRIIEIIVHEFAHEKSSDHLADAFADSIASSAGLLVGIALDQPGLFTDTLGARS